MKLRIIFEDENVLVVDKPAGLVVNKSETTHLETLQDQLSNYFNLKDLGIGDRAGIVHRLDKETSGLLVIAKREKIFDVLQGQFKSRVVKKEYIALVHGQLKDDRGVISGDIGRIGKFGKFGIVKGGREATTEYVVLKRYVYKGSSFENILEGMNLSKNRINYLKKHVTGFTLLQIKPHSGRTHQIRVHLKSIGHAVVSDNLYAPAKLLKFDLAWCPRLFLHASYLEFKILKTKPPLIFKLDLPKDLKKSLDFLTMNNKQ